MLDVRGGQPQRLDLAQLPIDRLRRDELAQVLEGAVHALGAAALPLVGGGGGDGRRRLLMGVVGYSCCRRAQFTAVDRELGTEG